MFLVRGRWSGRIEVIACVEEIIAQKLISIAVKGLRAGLGFHLDRARSITSVLCTVVARQHAHFRNGINAGSDIECCIASIVQYVASVQFPVVVLDPAAIHTVSQKDIFLILKVLIAHAGYKSDQLREVTTIQLKLCNLPASD